MNKELLVYVIGIMLLFSIAALSLYIKTANKAADKTTPISSLEKRVSDLESRMTEFETQHKKK